MHYMLGSLKMFSQWGVHGIYGVFFIPEMGGAIKHQHIVTDELESRGRRWQQDLSKSFDLYWRCSCLAKAAWIDLTHRTSLHQARLPAWHRWLTANHGPQAAAGEVATATLWTHTVKADTNHGLWCLYGATQEWTWHYLSYLSLRLFYLFSK